MLAATALRWVGLEKAAAVEDCQSIYAHLAGPVQRIAQVQASAAGTLAAVANDFST